MSNIKVSIVMPVYNAEIYLKDALDSLIRQTLKEIEIICVDDGSTDGSLALLRDYEKKDPRVQVYTQENSYAGVARNKGYEHATGKYVLFLDADDMFELNLLEEAFQYAEEKQTDICVFNSNLFDVQKQIFVEYSWAFRKDLFEPGTVFSPKEYPNNENLFRMFCGWAWDKLIRRDFIEKTGLRFQAIRSNNDMFFVFLSLALAERIVCLDKKLIHKRDNSTTSITGTREKSWDHFYYALTGIQEELKKRGIYDLYLRAHISRCVNLCLWQLSTISGEAFVKIYNLLHEKGIKELRLLDVGESVYFSKSEYQQICRIANEPLLPFQPKKEITENPESEKTGKDPFVSVVIPLQNDGEHFETCLESLLKEDLKELEILCVDAGISAENNERIARFASEDPRIRRIPAKERDFGSLLNRGIEAAKGEYLAFAAPGDLVSPSMHSELYRICKKYDLDVVKANYYALKETSDRFFEAYKGIRYNEVLSAEEMPDISGLAPSIWSGMYKRSFLEENGIGFSETSGAENGETAFEAKIRIAAKRTMHVKKPYYHKRMEAEPSLIRSANAEQKKEQAARQKSEKEAAALKNEGKKKKQSGVKRLLKPLKRAIKRLRS